MPKGENDVEVVRKLGTYLKIVCDKKNGITAQEVADVYQFGIQEDPQHAKLQLAYFVEHQLPGIEVAAAAAAAAAAARELISTDTVNFLSCILPQWFLEATDRGAEELPMSACMSLLTWRCTWVRLYDKAFGWNTTPESSLGGPKGK